MHQTPSPDYDVTVVVRTRDDEERIGHVLGRIAAYLRAHRLSFELLVADEGSGDNTLAVAALLRPSLPEVEVLHAPACQGLYRACQQARGRLLVLCDARTDAPLAPLGFALARLGEGLDVVAVGGRYVAFRRTRAWRAFESLVQLRDPLAVERHFLRRARALGLRCAVAHPRRTSVWDRLRVAALAPLLPLRLALNLRPF